MLFLLIALIGFIAFIVFLKNDIEIVKESIGMIWGIYLFFLCVVGTTVHSAETDEIEEYLSFQDRLENYYEIYPYRSQLSEGEIDKIIEYNRWIERGQINNKSLWFGWFTPNRFENLRKIDIGELL